MTSGTTSVDTATHRQAVLGRLLRWAGGLALCSTAVWLSLQVGLGLSPWDVLHAGIAHRGGLPFGTVVVVVGLVVVAVAAALRVRPTLGTLVNVVLVGAALNALLGTGWLDGLAAGPVGTRVAVLVGAVGLLGFGSALYLSAGFGAGPRDSLMVAAHHHGLPIGVARCAIEVSVLVVGWMLGGPVGLGTVVVAFGTGPAVQASFRLLRRQPPAPPRRPE